jgi:hypothetical protein
MGYSLVLRARSDGEPGAKDFGENVFLDDLSADYKVFVFYYPGAMVDEAMENKLKDLGRITGKNVFVNIGRLNDPQLSKIVSQFHIRNYPVVVVTALAGLASPPDEFLSAYARLDSKHLLGSPERTYECVQTIASLFMAGSVAEAVSKAKWTQRTEALKALAHFMSGPLQAIGGFIADRDISVSVAEGKFELKKSGG